MRAVFLLLALPALAAAQNVSVYVYPDGRRVAVWDDLPVRVTTSRPIVASSPAPPPVVLPALPPAPIVYNVPPVYYQPMPARSVPAAVPFAYKETTTFATGAAGSSGSSSVSYRTGAMPTAVPRAATSGGTRPLFGVGGGIYGPFGGGIRADACIGGRP